MAGIRLAAFWPRQAKDGSWYLEGKLGNGTIRLYENSYKKTDKDPSHVMYISEGPKQNQSQGRQAQGGSGFAPGPQRQAPSQPPKNYAPQSSGDSAPPGQWDDGDPGGDLPF